MISFQANLWSNAKLSTIFHRYADTPSNGDLVFVTGIRYQRRHATPGHGTVVTISDEITSARRFYRMLIQ